MNSSDTRNQEQQLIKQLFNNQQRLQQNCEKLINSLQQENHKLRLDNAELQEKLRQNNKTHQSRIHPSQQPRHGYNEQHHYAKLIQEKDAEITALKNSLDVCICKTQNEKLQSKSHENVHDEFFEHYETIEFRLPREMKSVIDNKQEFWERCCDIYQKSFIKCREAIHKIFSESLIDVTELSDKEKECGEIDFARQKELIHIKAAYEYLLKHCTAKITEINKPLLVNEVMATLTVPDIRLNQLLYEQATRAVEICWKMQTVSPPMFLCQPQIFNEQWHQTQGLSWPDKPGELIYYKPVLMYSAGGIVARKGLVRFKPVEHHLPEMVTSSKCKQEVNPHESYEKRGHNYHRDCFTCSVCFKSIIEESPSFISKDGSLFCNNCIKTCYCGQNYRYDGQGLQMCPQCSSLLQQGKCFKCKRNIIRMEKIEKGDAIYHKSCVCICYRPSPGMNNICTNANCTKVIINI